MTPKNVCKKCERSLERCHCGEKISTTDGFVAAGKQHLAILTHHQTGSTESAHGTTTMSDLQQQLDELKRNIDREVSRRVKNTFESNTQLKLEVYNLRGELTDLRASNKDAISERDKLHGELVKVRSALADVSAERDSLRTTLASWEAADTAPFVKVPDVADHVAPPVLNRGEPDPANDPKDAGLEFRNVVPTPEMIKHVDYWDLVSGAAAIAFTTINQGLVFWRITGSREWRTDPCPQPLKPHGMTWQQLDEKIAALKARPMCSTCHGCQSELQEINGSMTCCNGTCKLTNTNGSMYESPYYGHCKAKDLEAVRHE